MDCCNTGLQHPHLVIIGGGSAAFSATIRAHELGANVTMINSGLPIGGTCVNVGCVPSKTLIRAAEQLHKARRNPFSGVRTWAQLEDFRTVIRQKQELVETLRQAKYLDVVSAMEGFTLLEGRAKFLDARTVSVNGTKIRGDAILIATGATTYVPEVPGLEKSGFLTHESLFAMETLPESMVVLGGRYVALEIAQMFARFGTKVTVLQRSERILPTESADITDALTAFLADEGVRVVTGVTLREVSRNKQDVAVHAAVAGNPSVFRAKHVVVATGRRPNTCDLGLERAGVETDTAGAIRVDDRMRTSVPGIYAAGDVIGKDMFVYTAAAEGALAAENAVTGSNRSMDSGAVPWVIFTDPQLAGVGMDEREALAAGMTPDTATLPLRHVPRAIAARDTRGFVKLIRDRDTGRIIGGRVLAPEGGELVMEIAMAIRHRMTDRELADMLHPYLTLAEAVKLAAISFGKDINKLSCCAT